MSMKNESAEAEDKNMNQYQRALQSHFIAQWITSLAISVVCCAILFVVFAGYIVKLHEKTNIAEVRLEVLTERHNQLQSEVMQLRRAPLVQINSQTAPQVSQQTGEAVPADAQTPPTEVKTDDAGITLNQPEAAAAPEAAAPAKPAEPVAAHAKPATKATQSSPLPSLPDAPMVR